MNTKTTKKSNPSPILSVRIPAQLLEELDTVAKDCGMKRSTLVNLALRRGVTKLKKVAQFLSAE